MKRWTADLLPGDVIDLDEGVDDEPDVATVESVPRWDVLRARYIVWVKGDKLPVYLPAHAEFTLIEKEEPCPIST